MQDLKSRIGILGELMGFLWKRKLFWLIPMIVVLIVFAALLLLKTNPVTAPFVYPLF